MDTEERLGKLERELLAEKRRNRWLLAAVGLGLVGVGLAWTWGNIGEKVIRANQFSLVDKNGKVRAELKTYENSDGPRLVLFDNTGKPRAALGVGNYSGSLSQLDGPWLNLFDENGRPRAVLSVGNYSGSLSQFAGPELTLFDENGKSRVKLGATSFKTGLSLYDENDKPRVWLDVDKDGSGLTLFDENGKVIRSLP